MQLIRATPAFVPSVRHRPRSATAQLLGALALCALVGATGCVGGGLGTDAGGLNTDASGSGGTGDPGATKPLFNGPKAAADSTGLRRLTVAEYANGARDLLGTQLTVSTTLLADDIADNFDNNVAALGMSTARLQAFQTTAEALATELTGSATQLEKLAPCSTPAGGAACVTTYVQTFGKRAWRRPLSADEVASVVALATATPADPYATQINKATVGLLMSPYYLFKVELAGSSGPVGAYELATRLSYFLWSSTPDDALLAVAADGSLLKDDVFAAQVTRMLDDDKAGSLSENFGRQWLGVRTLEVYEADPKLFPAWNDGLRQSMLRQVDATFNDLVTGKVALPDYINGTSTYVDSNLAKFYGLPPVNGSNMVRVSTVERGPLLTQGAVLASTSTPTRTNIILRGKYVLTQLLCTDLGAPPSDVGTLAEDVAAVTQRQELQQHASQPGCDSCHSQMDPYGFVLEPFDAIGASRTLDNGVAIDPTATLPDGTQVQNPAQMSEALAKNPRVAGCVVQNLVTFAIGRSLVAADAEQINALTSKFVGNGQKLDQLVVDIVHSPLFRQRS